MRIDELKGRFSGMTAVVLLTSFMSTPTRAQIDVSPGSVVMEIIVKFSDESSSGRLINRYVDRNSQDLEELSRIGDELHASTGFVLTPERVTSGRELVVEIPEQPLLERIRDVVVERTNASRAELITLQTENPRIAQAQLLIGFRRLSDEAKLLSDGYGEDGYAERVQTLASELSAPSGVPVRGVSRDGTELAIAVDRIALVDMVVARLKALEDVQYVQQNTTVGISQ